MNRSFVVLACVVTAALALSGCSGSGQSDDLQVPKVQNPLQLGKFKTNPCALVTLDQVRSLQLPDAEKTDGDHEQCIWEAKSDQSEINVGWDIEDNLSQLYQTRQQAKYFEPTTVDGYPAVFTGGEAPDRRKSGECTVEVAVNDTDRALDINADYTKRAGVGERSCDLAKQAAGYAINTIKGG